MMSFLMSEGLGRVLLVVGAAVILGAWWTCLGFILGL